MFNELSISQENFQIIQPVLLVSRLFGILPIQYFTKGSYYILKKSLPYGIYSYILMILLIAFTLLGVVDDLEKDENHSIRMKDAKSRYVTCGDISIVVIIVVFGTITLPVKLKQLWKLLHCLNQVDSIIPLINQKKFRRSSIYFMTATFVVTVLVICFDIAVYADTTRKRVSEASSFFKNYIAFYLLYLVIIAQEVLFWHLVFFVKIRVSALNRYLRCIGGQNVGKLYQKRIKLAIYPSNKVESGLEKTKTTEKICLTDQIISLTKFQENISDAVQSLNNCTAFGIHLITLSCLLHLIVTPYFLLMEITKPNGSPSFITLQIVWLLAHIGRLLIIIEPCQLCLNEVYVLPAKYTSNKKSITIATLNGIEHNRTAGLLCDLLIKNFDENVKNSLIIFAMQLKYCKINFSCCGFFKINRSLLTTMAGAVTTYLVILFQFNT